MDGHSHGDIAPGGEEERRGEGGGRWKQERELLQGLIAGKGDKCFAQGGITSGENY